MAVHKTALVLTAMILLGSSVAQAQKLPLQLEQKSTQKVRFGAPIPAEFEFIWNGPGILKGRVSLSVRDSGRLLSSAISSPLVLTGRKNDLRMMLPTVEGLANSDHVELHARFIVDEEKGEVDLGARPMRVPMSNERVFRVVFCDQFSFKLDPDIAAALQRFSVERYWRPLVFDNTKLNIPGVNKLSRHTPAQQDPSEKLLLSLIGRPEDISTTTDRYEPADMPVDPHWYCNFNVVLMSESGFARLRTPQLNALAEWVRAGGSLCVEPLGLLEDRHLDFLNSLASTRLAGPYTLGVEGRIELLEDSMFEKLTPGLGHFAVLHKPLDGKQQPGSRVWKELVAFLWKFRKVQRDAVRDSGHFRLGDPTLSQFTSLPQLRPQLPPNFNQLSRDQKVQAQAVYNQQRIRYQQQRAVRAQRQALLNRRQQMLAQARMYGNVSINIKPYYPPGSGLGGLEFQAIQSGDGLLKRLIPEEVEIVPLEYIAAILVLYVLAIGPGEYFLLGLFRLRRFTWITFPLLTVGFTLFTVWLSNDYLSSSVERTHATVIDVGEDGSALRENRFELLYTASTHDVVTELDRGLFTPIDHTRFGAEPQNLQTQRMAARGRVPDNFESQMTIDPPVLDGKPPGSHHAVQNVPQWTPQINRIFRIAPSDEAINKALAGFDWTRPWNLRRDASEIQRMAAVAFGPDTKAIGFASGQVLFGNPAEFFTSTMSTNHKGQIDSINFLTDISVRQPRNLFEVVSQIAPHGGGNFEDLTLLDISDDSQSLLLIVAPDPDGLRIYRRLYRNDDTYSELQTTTKTGTHD
jgi:hypothetical protein